MRSVNLEKELVSVRNRRLVGTPDDLLNKFKELLRKEDQLDELIFERIKSSLDAQPANLNIESLDPQKIFDLEDIRTLCVKFRLRFLDGGLFKGDIPYEAIAKVKALQKNHQTELSDFKIVAPAELFNLKEKDKDPLLFVPIADNQYYLIHKWGNDLHPLRALLVYPFRSFVTLFKSVVGLAFLISAVIPSSVMMGPYDTTSLHIRVILFFYLFLAFAGLTALYGFSRMKNFNSALWQSQYTD
jgi:hypothetical protein